MSNALAAALLPPLIDRGVLLANHVLRAQPTATDRLLPHAGRCVIIEWQAPAVGWPTPPSVQLQITPAGLLERIDRAWPPSGDATALRVRIELPAPHRWPAMVLAGARPRVEVDGDAQFAADVAWLADHLKWDVEHDVAGVVGDLPARFLAQASQAAAQGVRRLASGFGSAWERRSGAGAAPQR